MLSDSRLNQFSRVLKDYRPIPEAVELLRDINFVAFFGPSASGKNTIIKDLVESGLYYYIVSDTTRQKRINNGIPEKDGVEYWFRDEEDFLSELKKGQFLEAEIIHNQQVSGVSLRELQKARSLKKTAVADLDIGGIEKVLSINEMIKVYLILPPSFNTWIKRLKLRNPIDEQEIKRRLITAVRIFKSARTIKNLIIVINTNHNLASKNIRLNLEQGEVIQHGDSNDMLNRLILETEDYLSIN